MALLQAPGCMARPSAPVPLLLTLLRAVRWPHQHGATLPLCHGLARVAQKALDALVAEELVHALPVPEVVSQDLCHSCNRLSCSCDISTPG